MLSPHKRPSVEDVVNFSRFLTLTPLRRQFFNTIHRQIWQILNPSPLQKADVLNGWSLSPRIVLEDHALRINECNSEKKIYS